MNNPPAFPVLIVDRPEELTHFNGMTLRDYFAAKALPQCFAVSATTDIAAREAYRMADAMLAEREKT